MASLTLSSGVNSPSEKGNRGFRILEEYLQPSSSTTSSAAAQNIHGLAEPLLYGSNTDDLEDFVWEFWGIFLNVAKQIPYDSPSQERLIELVKALIEIPATTIQVWGVSLSTSALSSKFHLRLFEQSMCRLCDPLTRVG
jgi:hypothetical protein